MKCFNAINRRIRKYVFDWKIRKLKDKGLRFHPDCRFMGVPNCGSEPWLISIGARCTICAEVMFITHDGATWIFRNDPSFNAIRYGIIKINDNCFIGPRTIILPNVMIGPNSIVGAGSVVTRDIPPNTIAAGNPATAISDTNTYKLKCLSETPSYDKKAYIQNKKKVLLELFSEPK